MIDTAAYLLESALTVASNKYKPLVYAVYFLESAIYYEGGINATSSALLKNTGLAHVNLIQNKLVPSFGLPLPNGRDILSTVVHIDWPVKR